MGGGDTSTCRFEKQYHKLKLFSSGRADLKTTRLLCCTKSNVVLVCIPSNRLYSHRITSTVISVAYLRYATKQEGLIDCGPCLAQHRQHAITMTITIVITIECRRVNCDVRSCAPVFRCSTVPVFMCSCVAMFRSSCVPVCRFSVVPACCSCYGCCCC